MTNPLYDRQRESPRTTINGVPAIRLRGRLPMPKPCPYCSFPCFELDDPDAQMPVDGGETKRGRFLMRAEWDPLCLDPAKRNTAAGMAPLCGHPYHLVVHNECRPGRIMPVFPRGLLIDQGLL